MTQGTDNTLFAVVITDFPEYAVKGGPGGKYRLNDIDLFAVFDGAVEPVQITFEFPKL